MREIISGAMNRIVSVKTKLLLIATSGQILALNFVFVCLHSF
jgi:hypothetical protein